MENVTSFTLYEDADQMRATAGMVQRLAEDFDGLRVQLKASIEDELNTACAGEVADEFTRYYGTNIDPKLVAEKERLDGIVGTLRGSANNFDSATNTVKRELY